MMATSNSKPEIILKEIGGSHHYWVDGTYCYSVTALLGEAAPKGKGFEEWLKRQTPESSEQIKNTAAEFGIKIHNTCEDLLLGEEINIVEWRTQFSSWERKRATKTILSFVRWFEDWGPTNLRTEHKVAHLPLRYAGTLDLFCKIDGVNTIVDFKTSSAIHLTHELQITAYKEAYQEMYGIKIDKTYVLRLGSRHASGYEFKEVIKPFSSFKNVYNMFLDLHEGKIPNPPLVDKYPEKIKLTIKK